VQHRVIARTLGKFFLVIGLAMLLPLAWGLPGPPRDLAAFLIPSAIGIGGGAALYLAFRTIRREITRRDALALVTLSWIGAALLGALPFLISGAVDNFTDAWFEAMSGFTTTGATVIEDVTALSREMLFWRSFTQWLGGMGIIVLFIAILPYVGMGVRRMFKGEVPGPVKEGLTPRIQQTARTLWLIYLGLSVVQAALLMYYGMTFHDAVCHTCTTIATGGFSTRNESVGWYASFPIEAVLVAVMAIAGANFSLHYRLLTRRSLSAYLRDSEFRVYAGILLGATLLITANLTLAAPAGGSLLNNARNAGFTVVSIMTTTGFGTADFDQWPSFSRLLLVALMVIGGSAGSTGGGIKVVRLIVLVKNAYSGTYRVFRPHAVKQPKLNGRPVSDDVVQSVNTFFVIFIFIFVAATLVMTGLGIDPVTAFSAVAATLGNIGPGLGLVGPTATYAWVPPPGKWVLSACMLFGRLELFTVLCLLIPSIWKR